MNFFEKQAKLQRELFDIQTRARKQITELNEQTMSDYLAVNEEFAAKLPEGTDFSAWGELQREYGETVWSSMQWQMEATGEVMKTAVEEWNQAITTAYSPEVEAEVIAPVKKAPVKRAPVKRAAAKRTAKAA